jgi:hypothetical protein
VNLFSDGSLSFEQKCEKLQKRCAEKSKDNNTAIIVEIEEGDSFSFGSNDELDWTTFAEVEADYKQYVKDNEEAKEDLQTKPDKPDSKREEAETPKPKKEVPFSEKPLNRLEERPVLYGPPTVYKHRNRKRLPILLAVLAGAALALLLILRLLK